MPVNISLVEGKGRGGSQIRKREKLSCDAVLTDVSAHRMGNYKEGMKLQRCHGLGLSPTVLISHYMWGLLWGRVSFSWAVPPRGLMAEGGTPEAVPVALSNLSFIPEEGSWQRIPASPLLPPSWLQFPFLIYMLDNKTLLCSVRDQGLTAKYKTSS